VSGPKAALTGMVLQPTTASELAWAGKIKLDGDESVSRHLLAERAVPEWQATLDALQELPEIGTEGPVGYGGGITLGTAIGIPLTAIEPRITAAIFGGGFSCTMS